jgi:hypothetical protein
MVGATVATGVCFWHGPPVGFSHAQQNYSEFCLPSHFHSIIGGGSSKFVRYKILYTSSKFREDEKMEM